MRFLALLLMLVPPAWAVNVTDLILPGYAGVGAQGSSGSTNQMQCTKVTAWAGGTFTKMAGEYVVGVAGQTAGFGIYPDADSGAPGTVLASVSGSAASATGGAISQTGLSSFSLVTGTVYRLCECATSASVTYLAVTDSGTGTGHFSDLTNTFNSTSYGTAANNCSAGVPPSTTGVLTGSTGFRGPPILVFE